MIMESNNLDNCYPTLCDGCEFKHKCDKHTKEEFIQ